VEHNKEWYDSLRNKLRNNIKIELRSLSEEYENTVKTNERFDIIVIDGMRRNECIYASINSLSERGVIILDDSEREEYSPGKEFLKSTEYKRLDFWGIAPGIYFNKCTSIFFRKGNCLGI
jgi:hypothetical protein